MPKKEPKLTGEERERIHRKYLHSYPDQETLDLQIDLALDHDAAMKAGNSGSWNLYVRNWLNKQEQGGKQNGNRTRPTDRSLIGL